MSNQEQIKAKLRYQGKHYEQGQWARGGGYSKHLCTEAVELIESLESQLEEAQKWNKEMVEKAASGGTLDGYREQAARINELEQQLSESQEAVSELIKFIEWAKEANLWGEIELDNFDLVLDRFGKEG